MSQTKSDRSSIFILFIYFEDTRKVEIETEECLYIVNIIYYTRFWQSIFILMIVRFIEHMHKHKTYGFH